MKKADLLPGTLDMLILKTPTRAPLHGYGIAQSIKRIRRHLARSRGRAALLQRPREAAGSIRA
jgi:DNA-binding PadR family transcriptional regulator